MKSILISFFVLFISFLLIAQDEDKNRHEFGMLYEVETTPVKNQGKTGTCWNFATQSFIETELIRMGKGEFDLSEMYLVRNIYPMKAQKFIRYHGNTNFGEGGQAHDVMLAIDKFGLVPEEVFPGNAKMDDKHNHSEMVKVLKGVLDAVVNQKGKITDNWNDVVESILDIYLGENPDEFYYDGKEYTPESFAEMLGINTSDYIEFTSYTHYPMNEKVMLEIPDNWTNDLYYNVSLDDMMSIIDNALMSGYSVAWDGDVSEKTFDRKKGYAVIPVDDENDMDEDEDDEDPEPEKEKIITDDMRLETFETFSTTDDHLMHLTGIAENQEGTKFYYTKNSWGTKYKYDGFWYMSEPFVKLKTVAIMVHKDAVPEEIKTKLDLN